MSFTPTSSTTSYDTIFTGISAVGVTNSNSCYAPSPSRNSNDLYKVHFDNFTVQPDGIFLDTLYLGDNRTMPLYASFVDSSQEGWPEYTLDLANRSQVAMANANGDSLIMNENGFTMSSKAPDCNFGANFTIKQLLAQAGEYANITCSGKRDLPANRGLIPALLRKSIGERGHGIALDKRIDDNSFVVVANLQDQCDLPTRTDLPVSASVGDTPCDPAAAIANGTYTMQCYFPGQDSDLLVCEANVVSMYEWLASKGIGTGCPSTSELWAVLCPNFDNVLTPQFFIDLLVQQGVDPSSPRATAWAQRITSLFKFICQLWGTPGPDGKSLLVAYFENYSNSTTSPASTTTSGPVFSSAPTETPPQGVTNFKEAACKSANDEKFPLPVILNAGATETQVASLSEPPRNPSTIQYEGVVQDPAQRSCCHPASKCMIQGGNRWYDTSARIDGPGGIQCICGMSSEGNGIGFQSYECDSYQTSCDTSDDCEHDETCLAFNCCEKSICIKNSECVVPGATRKTRRNTGAWMRRDSGLMSGGSLPPLAVILE